VSVIQTQAEPEAEGNRVRGRRPRATLNEPLALVARMNDVAESVGSLCQEVHTVWEAVVPWSSRVLDRTQRHREIETLLDLVDALVPVALPALQTQIQMLSTQIRLALPHTLVCARRLETRQEHAPDVLGAEAVALLAWAWVRRALLGPTPNERLQGLAPAW